MAKKDSRAAAREGSQLDERLSDYAAIIRISATAKTLYRRTGNWPIYAAATGSALAMATGASASIITSGIVSGVYPSGVSVNAGGPTTQLGLIPGLSVKIFAHSSATGPIVQLQMLASQENLFFSPIAGYAKNFGLGSPIGLGLNTGVGHTEIVKAFFTGNLYGNFAPGQPGFVGLSFSTGHGNTDYGWIQLVFRDQGGIPHSLEALAFGIDTNPGQTPGTLLAGEINNGFIPEPSTLSLAFLASGAAGVMALRRRRKQSASAATIS
jgi:PEP-CTERM motif